MQSSELPNKDDDWKKRSSHKIKKRFGMEYRDTEEYIALFNNDTFFTSIFGNRRKWRKYYQWYETAKQRDQAMMCLAEKTCWKNNTIMHEYRTIER